MPIYYFFSSNLNRLHKGGLTQGQLIPALTLSLLSGCMGDVVTSFRPSAARAQSLVVTPDGLTPTVVENSLDCSADCTITGQPIAGESLFHSFSQFSLAEGVRATFEDAGAANIFARVSDEMSIINGTLAVTGAGEANLFFLNPHGIVFGESAELSLAGSFLASSADSVMFSNGEQFGLTHQNSSPLTISTPVGLQFGANPGAIMNRSAVSAPDPFTQVPSFANVSDRPSGLQVAENQTLALVGRGVFLEGAGLTAKGGRIEIGSVAENSLVAMAASLDAHGLTLAAQMTLDYEGTSDFADVSLTDSAQIDVGGDRGMVSIRGRNLSITDNSSVSNFSAGLARPGEISLIASERIELNDSFIFFPRFFGVFDQGGALNVTANQLFLKAGSVILGGTLGPRGDGGNITINAFESVELSGASLDTPNYITVSSLGGGSGGRITIDTQRLLVADGSQIESFSVGSGPGGDVEIHATDRIDVIGAAPAATASVANRLLNGAGVSFESTSTGPSVSRIVATSGIEEISSERATGLGGSLTLNTGTLTVSDRAQVTVGSFGPGDSGDLAITARQILLDERALLSADSVLGNGGNLELTGLETLILRRGSRLSARSGAASGAVSGSGGNIFIDSDFVVAHPFEDSDIVASATSGQGGNIEINTRGVYGITPRKATIDNGTNDIDASSDFGVSGTTAVNVINPSEVGLALSTLTAQPIDKTTMVTQLCGASGNRFVVSARGGVPASPSSNLTVGGPLVDLGDELSVYPDNVFNDSVFNDNVFNADLALTPRSGHSASPNNLDSSGDLAGAVRVVSVIAEAQGWRRDATGQVHLTVQSENSSRAQGLTPAAHCSGS